MLLNNQQKTQRLITLYDKALEPMANIFNKENLDSKFKLVQQKWLESIMESHNVSIKNISWELVSSLESPDVKRFQLKVNFSGRVNDLRGIVQALESQTPLVYVAGLVVNIKNQSKSYLGNANGDITLHFFMKNNRNVKGE